MSLVLDSNSTTEPVQQALTGYNARQMRKTNFTEVKDLLTVATIINTAAVNAAAEQTGIELRRTLTDPEFANPQSMKDATPIVKKLYDAERKKADPGEISFAVYRILQRAYNVFGKKDNWDEPTSIPEYNQIAEELANHVIVSNGPSCSRKTTVADLLAVINGGTSFDVDAVHELEAVKIMSRGESIGSALGNQGANDYRKRWQRNSILLTAQLANDGPVSVGNPGHKREHRDLWHKAFPENRFFHRAILNKIEEWDAEARAAFRARNGGHPYIPANAPGFIKNQFELMEWKEDDEDHVYQIPNSDILSTERLMPVYLGSIGYSDLYDEHHKPRKIDRFTIEPIDFTEHN